MPIRLTGLLCGGLLLLSTATAVAAGPIDVHIRVEGASRTRVSNRTVTLSTAQLVKDGHTERPCPGQSAAGALEQGTGGAWSGSWDDSFGDYLVDTIKGEKHPGSPDYWALWINHRQASAGVCGSALKAGDSVLFFVDRCIYDAATQGCTNKPFLPLGVSVPRTVRLHKSFFVKVVRYSATGKATPAAGAIVLANGKRVGKKKTNSKGLFRVTATHAGRVRFQARKAGSVRTEIAVTTIKA